MVVDIVDVVVTVVITGVVMVVVADVVVADMDRGLHPCLWGSAPTGL